MPRMQLQSKFQVHSSCSSQTVPDLTSASLLAVGMAPMKLLSSGGAIAGPAFAFWLGKLRHEATVIERAPNLRDQGQQIDLRGQAITIADRMSLLDKVRAKVVDESGFEFVD